VTPLGFFEKTLIDLLGNLWSEMEQALENWQLEQEQSLQFVGKIFWFDPLKALASMNIWLLGSAERLGRLLLALFQSIPNAALATARDALEEYLPTESSSQVLVRRRAISDAMRGIVDKGQDVANLDFTTGLRVTKLILTAKKFASGFSGGAGGFVARFISGIPMKLAIAVLEVAAAIWHGIVTIATIGILLLFVRGVLAGDYLAPLRQDTPRVRMRKRGRFRIPT